MPEIILLNVRWYCRYTLSYRDLEEMMQERGVEVDHSTLNRWVLRYAPELDKRIRLLWENVKGSVQTSESAYVLFDDTVLDKHHSSSIDLSRRQYSAACRWKEYLPTELPWQ